MGWKEEEALLDREGGGVTGEVGMTGMGVEGWGVVGMGRDGVDGCRTTSISLFGENRHLAKLIETM